MEVSDFFGREILSVGVQISMKALVYCDDFVTSDWTVYPYHNREVVK